MRNVYFLLFIFLLMSCELKEIPFYDSATPDENTIIVMDELNDLPEFNIHSFDRLSHFNQEDSYYFSLTQNAFTNQQFIFAYDVMNRQSFMQLNGEMIYFPGKQSLRNDSLHIKSRNDSIQIELMSVKIDSIREKSAYSGEINISINGINQFKSVIYGEYEP